MSINKLFNSLPFFLPYNVNFKTNVFNRFKIPRRYIFYDIEKNKSYYVCQLCRGSKIIKCLECTENIGGVVYNEKFIKCDKCINGEIECNLCNHAGLRYYFSI